MSRDEDQQMNLRLKALEKELTNLRAKEEVLYGILNSISEEAILIAQDYTVLEANKAFLEAVGLSKEEALGKKCYELLSRAGRICDTDPDNCPLMTTLNSKKKTELRVTQKVRGSLRQYLRIAYPVILEPEDPEGPCMVLELNRDLEDSKAIIYHLRHTEQRLQAILDSVSEAIVSINQDQEIVLFNRAAEEMFGYKSHEILGQDLKILVPPQYGDHYRFIREFLKAPGPRSINRSLKITALKRGGKEFPAELSISSLLVDGEYIFTAIIRDITEKVETERRLVQSERFAAVGKAVAHVVHELKTPLMIIGGLSQQLLRSINETATQKKLEIICEEVARLERLLLDLGDFTKEQRLVFRPFNINDLIRDIIAMMTGLPTSSKYNFITELYKGDMVLECDPDKLKQVLINLVVNAMEAMEEGGDIYIYTNRKPEHAVIKIRDSGMGIREEDLSHIFEPFYTTRKKGTGLGLSICYKIIQAHSGDITAESRYGEGTEFTISLPTKLR